MTTCIKMYLQLLYKDRDVRVCSGVLSGTDENDHEFTETDTHGYIYLFMIT